MSKQRVLIAGIGNIFLGDDAFGSEVARRLMQRVWPEEVRVVDFGIRGFDLAFALLDSYDLVIFIDAAPRGGKPGTLYKIEPDLAAAEDLDQQAIETHAMDPLKVLGMVKSMGGRLNKILLIGCEPAPMTSSEGEMRLSPAVEAATDEAVRMVEEMVSDFLGRTRIRDYA